MTRQLSATERSQSWKQNRSRPVMSSTTSSPRRTMRRRRRRDRRRRGRARNGAEALAAAFVARAEGPWSPGNARRASPLLSGTGRVTLTAVQPPMPGEFSEPAFWQPCVVHPSHSALTSFNDLCLPPRSRQGARLAKASSAHPIQRSSVVGAAGRNVAGRAPASLDRARPGPSLRLLFDQPGWRHQSCRKPRGLILVPTRGKWSPRSSAPRRRRHRHPS